MELSVYRQSVGPQMMRWMKWDDKLTLAEKLSPDLLIYCPSQLR